MKTDFSHEHEKQEHAPLDYASSGVDIHAGYKAVDLMKKHIENTKTGGVISAIGGFGAMFDLDKANLPKMEHPILVSGTDGVGTKLKLAFLADIHNTIGIDCVAMSVNDIACLGATPLFFLDYIACGKNKPEKIEAIVEGLCQGCIQSGAALVGGETAEMPGFYPQDEYDLAGFAVGIVDRANIVDGSNVKPSDKLIALPSSSIHSNGFSLIRKVFQIDQATKEPSIMKELQRPLAALDGKSLIEELLTPTKIYVKPILDLVKKVPVKAMAHITGGGFYENIPRVVPAGLTAVIAKDKIKTPPIFHLIGEKARLNEEQMFNTFNMGVGMVVIVAEDQMEQAMESLRASGENPYEIGFVTEDTRLEQLNPSQDNKSHNPKNGSILMV